MKQHSSDSKNSTNVRSIPWSLRALRAGFQTLGGAAPGLAAGFAERMFLTARRHPRPAWEHEMIERARPFQVPWGEGSLRGWSWGEGRTIVLVHGWEGRGAQLGAFVEPLVEAGFRVVTFDGPGHGDSSGSRASIVDFADALDRVIDAVGPVHGIVAHSMGAASTTLAMSRRLRASRLVFVAPPVDFRDFSRAFAAMFAVPASVIDRVHRRLEARHDCRIDEIHGARLAPRIQAPLLVVHDEGDKEVPWRDGKTLVDAWPGALLHTTSGLGHRRVLKAPEVIGAAITFLRPLGEARVAAPPAKVRAPATGSHPAASRASLREERDPHMRAIAW